jgi:hypothetical protein
LCIKKKIEKYLQKDEVLLIFESVRRKAGELVFIQQSKKRRHNNIFLRILKFVSKWEL